MASLFKNQIIKHLAKFFKNLSADSLNLSLRGHCHLNNLELNEDFLMEIFEFPVWLNLKRAVVNKCFIDVPYTKIKSQPCQLILDQVFIEIETVENFRQNTNYFNRLSNLQSGKYGLGERIIDGLKVKIDSVEIHFTSSKFNAQLSLLQIIIESRLPNFKPVNNISQTKIKDTNRNQILIFKYIEWSSLRFEARSETKTEEFQTHSSPLRLITRNGTCKITLKKSLLDCSTISARVQLNFDDLLWILTDATVLNFIQLLNYITELMNKAPMNKKNIMQESPSKTQSLRNNSNMNVTDIGRLFSQYDIIETSMHLIINRLQLHLSDDLNRSSFASLKGGGGLHVILQKLLIDFYPYHKAIAKRQHWLYYTETSMNREVFADEHLKTFFKINDGAKGYSNLFSTNSNQSDIDKRLKDLLSFVVLVRVGDYKINCVSTSENDSKKDKKFSKEERILIQTGAIPKDLPAVYLEINQYYYMEPGSTRISTRKKSPAATLFCSLAPSFINFDIVTFLWLNAFYSSIHKSLLKFASTLPQNETETDFHSLIEIILPTFSINLKNLYNEDDLPSNIYEILEIKSTKIEVKNSKGNFNDIEKLDNLFSKLRLSKLLNQTKDYPWISENANLDSEKKAIDYDYNCIQLMNNLKKELNACKLGFSNQFLIINCQPFWCDLKQTNQQNCSLIEPFDLTLWAQINKDIHQTTEPNLNVFCCFPDLKLHLDHFSLLFLIRLLEKIDYFSNILKSDFTRIQDNDKQIGFDLKAPLVIISTVLPHIELFIKMNTYDEFEPDKKEHSIQTNLSDKSSFSLSNENILEKEDFFQLNNHTNNVQLSINNEEHVDRSNKQMVEFQNQEQFEDKNNKLVDNGINSNSDVNLIKSIEEESNNELTTNKFGDTFVGLFNRNGYASISDTSMNTSVFDEDTRSIKSDLSVESEKIVFNFEDDTDSFIFRNTDNDDGIEEGVEITETLIKYQQVDFPMVKCRLKKASFISYLKITLRHVSFLNQNKNFIATILASVQELELDSHFKVPYSQFEKDCTSSLGLFRPVNYSNEPNLLARIDTDTKSVLSKGDKEMISVLIQGLDLKELDKRFIDCLSDFLIDEDALEVSKVKVLINDLKLKINDLNLKTPLINVNLKDLLIDRNTNNEIQIGPCLLNIKNRNNQLLAAHFDFLNRLYDEENGHKEGNQKEDHFENSLKELNKSSNDDLNEDEIEFTRENYLKLLSENRQLKAKLTNL